MSNSSSLSKSEEIEARFRQILQKYHDKHCVPSGARDRTQYTRLGKIIGRSQQTAKAWTLGTIRAPRIGDAAEALDRLGYEIIIVKKEDDE
jgi:hypothetical protein